MTDTQVDGLDVAAAVIEERPGPDQMQLHKLLYLVQAASLAWFNEPAYSNTIEAWKYGPVVLGVAEAYMDFGKDPITEIRDGDASNVSERTRWIVREIVQEYGHLSGLQLADLVKSRSGTPWRVARVGIPDGANSDKEIPTDVIRNYHAHHGVTWVVPSPEERPLAIRAREGDKDALRDLLAARGVKATVS